MTRKTLAFALLLLLAAGSSAAPIKLGPRYKDESNGFQIQIPSKWEQVPTKFQEVSVVGKWSGRPKRGAINPVLLVLRFLKPAQQEEDPTPQEALRRGIPGYADLLRRQPKDMWDYVRRYYVPGNHEVALDDADFKLTRKGARAHVRVLVDPAGGARRDADRYRRMFVAAEIRPEDEESDSFYGVLYGCAVADEKNMLATFKRSISRFRILDPDEEDEEDEDAASDADIFVNSEEKPEAWREARKRKLIPGWDAIDTTNYLIVFNKEVKTRLVKTIAKHIEAIRAQIYENLFPPAQEVKAISVVRVCKDRAEYHRYGGPPGSAGYWSRGDEELVFYQDKSNKKDSLRVLYHEAFHQYIHYAVGDVAPHSWFNEGHGDYFAGHNYVGRKFQPKPFAWRTGIIANAIARKTYVPLEQFLKYTQGQYYAQAGLCYAQGWSLVYFLREVERRKIKRYKKYWGLLDRYFAAIKRNVKVVKEQGLGGLPVKPDEPKDDETGLEEADEPTSEAPPAEPGLPRLPGLETPFPGEHPLAGAGEEEGGAERKGETRTVAGPQIRSVKTALDAAVDDALRGIDIAELEKDWIAFSK